MRPTCKWCSGKPTSCAQNSRFLIKHVYDVRLRVAAICSRLKQISGTHSCFSHGAGHGPPPSPGQTWDDDVRVGTVVRPKIELGICVAGMLLKHQHEVCKSTVGGQLLQSRWHPVEKATAVLAKCSRGHIYIEFSSGLRQPNMRFHG